MNETLQTIKARRSVRAYMEQQVSAEDLNLILEAATYAPNGMHLETCGCPGCGTAVLKYKN